MVGSESFGIFEVNENREPAGSKRCHGCCSSAGEEAERRRAARAARDNYKVTEKLVKIGDGALPAVKKICNYLDSFDA